MGKLRRKNEKYAQSHTASKWLNQDLNPKILRNFSQDHRDIICSVFTEHHYILDIVLGMGGEKFWW